MIHDIFPVPIYKSNVNRKITNDELSVVQSHSKSLYANSGNYTSLEKYILNKELNSLGEWFLKSLSQYIASVYSPVSDMEVYITQSWLNYTQKGGHHHRHNHPNSLVSGVFYFNANANDDSITFHRKIPPHFHFQSNTTSPYDSAASTFPVETGDLVLFPSDLDHEVRTAPSYETRISLAFNTFFKGVVGDSNNLTKLVI